MLPRFYPIFDDVSWIERVLPLGVRLVQLRIKNSSNVELRTQIATAQELCTKYNAILVVNDYWQIAIDLGCNWLHLGQEDLDAADISAIRNAGICLGVSTHDEAELDRALSLQPNYVALGPIYPTILKQMKWKQQGVDKLSEWKSRVGDIPLVAIGGMSIDRAEAAFMAGADIISAVTDITLNENPDKRVNEWLEIAQ